MSDVANMRPADPPIGTMILVDYWALDSLLDWSLAVGDGPWNAEDAHDAMCDALEESDRWCPPDHVVLPRADYEALRARAERLRGVCEEVSRLYPELSEQEDWVWRLVHAFDGLLSGDLTDNLRPLDDLPPLKLAGNPLDETDVEPAQH